MMFPFFKKKAPPPRKVPRLGRYRSYASAEQGRLMRDWLTPSSSSDSELWASQKVLRNRSRALVRDNSYARRIRSLLQGNIVGQGIGMQCVRNDNGVPRDKENDSVEQAWWLWSNGDGVHTAGILSLTDMLRLAVSEVFEAGEVLMHFVPKKFGHSKVPLAIEVIEAERLVDYKPTVPLENGHSVRMGVETDEWGRPVAYWVYRGHPGDGVFRGYNSDDMVRIPAEDCCHLYVCNRWPQTRGEPWMATVIRCLRDTGEYTRSELVAARASASIMGFIQKPDDASPDKEDEEEDEEPLQMEPGTVWKLHSGESFNGFSPSRPNAASETFLSFMIREVAAGCDVSYEALSKDYSKSNYSSSRLSILDDRQGYRVLQQWLIRQFLYPLYVRWFRAAYLAGAIKVTGGASEEDAWLMSARFRPPGWSWVDPTKEVNAMREAVKAGFMTVSDVIAQTGGGQDAEDVFKARRKELDLMDSLGLKFTTTDTKAEDESPPEKSDGEGTEKPDKEDETDDKNDDPR